MSHHIPYQVGSALRPSHKAGTAVHAPKPLERKQTYSKTFRWTLPSGQTDVPHKVEVAGTFSDWKKLPMSRDVSGAWHLAMPHIPGHRTHRYMFFADDRPVQDKHCDGLATPHSHEEEKFAIATPRGPRVFMLFAQSK
ncbi:MAG TPA: glycogen-binding domain-containing protein [Verrucomicrobiae bacterium]|nr:glycogen-binding domain-containing protein [Verrucomicrobiae bacterium]